MRKAASIVCWAAFVLRLALYIVYLAVNADKFQDVMINLIISLVFFSLLELFLLIWREYKVNNSYEKDRIIPCAICILIFVSVIGGILTLLIPENQLGNGYVSEEEQAENEKAAAEAEAEEKEKNNY